VKERAHIDRYDCSVSTPPLRVDVVSKTMFSLLVLVSNTLASFNYDRTIVSSDLSEANPRYFKTLLDWRDWLSANHADAQGIWIIIQKKASQKPGIRYQEAVLEAVAYGWIDGKIKRLNDTEFMQRYTHRRWNSIWSRSNRERAEQLIAEGRMTPEGLRTVEEAKQSGRWDQAYTIPKTEAHWLQDFLDDLKTNPIAYQNFTSFPPSARMMYLHWITEAKRQDTRARRIHTVITRSTQNLRPGINLKIIKKSQT
jgi:uncharacterized protein YdeI (YjbR/CyaY-like superfamily)